MAYRAELGRATWWYLHWWAQQPGAKDALPRLRALLKRAYPCALCRANLTPIVDAQPAPARDADVPLWMARFHNRVREALGAPIVFNPTPALPLSLLYHARPPRHHDPRIRAWIAQLSRP